MKHSKRFLKLAEAARKRVGEISLEEALGRTALGNAVLIDVREESEWEEGHIPGAVHIGKGVLERDIEKHVPDTSTPIILYCGGGYRSAIAAESLQDMGYKDVLSMEGGYRGFRESMEKGKN